MEIILKPFSLLLGWLYSISGSYGLAIILFCLIFKILLFPISIKGRKSMLDMSRLTERQKELQQKYGRDRARYSQELAELYARENVKPSGGCLWSFLPLPLLMALYGVVSSPFTHLMGLSRDQITTLSTTFLPESSRTVSQLALTQPVYDNFAKVQASMGDIAAQITANGGPINFDFFGLNLSDTPDLFFFKEPGGFSWASVGLFMIPIISAIFAVLSMLVNQHINKKVLSTGGNKQSDLMNKQMMIFQPVISLWIGFTLPAALGLYWVANSIFAILQEFCSIGLLKKHIKINNEKAAARAIEYKEKEKEQKRLLVEQKKQKQEEQKRIRLERTLATDGISESRVGMRAYARGRTFDAGRYPTTEYHDPDEMIRENAARRLEAAAAQAAKRQQKDKAKKDKSDETLPTGMLLNQSSEGSRIPTAEVEPMEETLRDAAQSDELLADVRSEEEGGDSHA